MCVIATPDGTKFLDTARLTEQTGHPVRSQYKGADDPDVLPPADAFVVAPASFNTVNKWALGISETLALGLLCEAVGLELPMAAVPCRMRRWPAIRPSSAAWPHCGTGRRVIFDPARLPGVAGGGAPFPSGPTCSPPCPPCAGNRPEARALSALDLDPASGSEHGGMKQTTAAIAATGLRKSFGDTVVLDGIDLNVPAGTIFSLLGPNGAGKTTTVKILSTLITADAGAAAVAGHDLRREPDLVRAVIGVTGQFSAIDGLLTGRENLILMADLDHLGRSRAAGGPTSCSASSTWPARAPRWPRPTPAACSGGSISR